MSTPAKYEGHTPMPWEVGLVDHQHDIYNVRNTMLLLPGNAAVYVTGSNQEANARLIADAPALLADNERLREALRAMLKLLDEGKLVRNISGDGASDWAMKQLPMIQVLSAAAKLAYPDEAALAEGKGENS